MRAGTRRRSVAWLAILAISAQFLWPFLAQAKPGAVALVPICAADGSAQFQKVPIGGERRDAVPAKCPLCVHGANLLACVSAPSVVALPPSPAAVRVAVRAAVPTYSPPSGAPLPPRAPPALT